MTVKSKAKKILLPLPENCVQAIFIDRPQRFLIEAKLKNSRKVTAYCANPGSMKGCERRGSKIILWDSKDKNRSRVHTWKAIKLNKLWVGTDTHVSNVLLIESLKQGLVPEFKGYSIAAKEAEISMGARVDFLLHKSGENCWVEVKSSFVVNRGIAQFPDSISPRSLSQIKHLERKARSGDRAVVVFVVQREDADSFKVNSDVFPEYARALRRAQESGVEVLALKYAVTSKGYAVPRKLEVINEIRGRILHV